MPSLQHCLTLAGWIGAQFLLHASFAAQLASGDDATATVLSGRVIAPDGTPAVGAVVVTSAGGQALTDARGTYRFELHLPSGAESVQITAVASDAGRNLVASARVAIPAAGEPSSLALSAGGSCQPSWVPTFGGQPGVGSLTSSPGVECFAVFDDGSGPALYVAGAFPAAGGVEASNIARWDGTTWAPLGIGLSSRVYALTVFDDGSGAALYAGGVFQYLGGFQVLVNFVARWDGSSWSTLGTGTNGTVSALTVYDDGSGPALYAGGSFTTAGGVSAHRIARWNGSSWSALGSGMSGGMFTPEVEAISAFDDGNGPALYTAGSFTTAGGVTVNNVAKWDGASWSALGSGLTSYVAALAVFDDGSGAALYAGGGFFDPHGLEFRRMARWDGSSWSSVGTGMNDPVWDLTVFDDGSGAALYAGGVFTTAGSSPASHCARWDGSDWSEVGSALNGNVRGLGAFDDGSGLRLFAGGDFTTASGAVAQRIARLDGSSWSALGAGLDSGADALAVHDDGSGPALYAGGSFTSTSDGPLNRIAKWDGATWSPLGSGMNGFVHALAVFDDGGGPVLYAGGSFTTAGGTAANRIARWDGASWSPLGNGMTNTAADVKALAVFDDGSGAALYAGGAFVLAGGLTVNRIARWDGSSWSALGTGMNGTVHALAVYDDGSGAALYAGGEFLNAGGVAASRIAKWNGASWAPLIGPGSGTSGFVYALTVLDDGSGAALYAGGAFLRGGGMDLNRVGRWDGSSWSPLGTGMSYTVFALAVFDDGSGPALHAGGDFLTAGGMAVNRITKWDGASWSALGSGISAISSVPGPRVSALLSFDDGCGPALYAGGRFESTLDSHESFLARWQGCLDLVAPTLACPPGVLVTDDRTGPPGEVVTFEVTASDPCHAAPPVVCVPPSGSFFPRGTTTVNCTATDEAGNQTTCSFPVTVAPPHRARVR